MGYCTTGEVLSTTVEIILYYLTISAYQTTLTKSTTVEIILYYLTLRLQYIKLISTTVEIILYYLTVAALMSF